MFVSIKFIWFATTLSLDLYIPWLYPPDLSEAIDVYSDWIDACENANAWPLLYFKLAQLIPSYVVFLHDYTRMYTRKRIIYKGNILVNLQWGHIEKEDTQKIRYLIINYLSMCNVCAHVWLSSKATVYALLISCTWSLISFKLFHNVYIMVVQCAYIHIFFIIQYALAVVTIH